MPHLIKLISGMLYAWKVGSVDDFLGPVFSDSFGGEFVGLDLTQVMIEL